MKNAHLQYLGPNDPCPTCGKKMKRCPGHKKSNRKMLVVLAIATITVVVALFGVFYEVSNKPKAAKLNGSEKTTIGLTNNELILKKLSASPVSSKYFSAFIYLGGKDLASGTAYRNSTGGWNIVTASHLFRKGRRGVYTFRIISPADDRTYYINSVKEMKEADVVTCVSGDSKVIEGFSEYTDWHGKITLFPASALGKEMFFTSLVTGETYRCVGFSLHDDERDSSTSAIEISTLLIAYDSLPGESGSGFIQNGGDKFLVLSARMGDLGNRFSRFISTLREGESDKLTIAYMITMP